MSFLEHFAELPDPRSDINRKYELLDINNRGRTTVSQFYSNTDFGKQAVG